MKVWVVVAVSCSECNALGAAVFGHKPSEDEAEAVSLKMGGMYCISNHVIELDVNGESVEQKLHD